MTSEFGFTRCSSKKVNIKCNVVCDKWSWFWDAGISMMGGGNEVVG